MPRNVKKESKAPKAPRPPTVPTRDPFVLTIHARDPHGCFSYKRMFQFNHGKPSIDQIIAAGDSWMTELLENPKPNFSPGGFEFSLVSGEFSVLNQNLFPTI